MCYLAYNLWIFIYSNNFLVSWEFVMVRDSTSWYFLENEYILFIYLFLGVCILCLSYVTWINSYYVNYKGVYRPSRIRFRVYLSLDSTILGIGLRHPLLTWGYIGHKLPDLVKISSFTAELPCSTETRWISPNSIEILLESQSFDKD